MQMAQQTQLIKNGGLWLPKRADRLSASEYAGWLNRNSIHVVASDMLVGKKKIRPAQRNAYANYSETMHAVFRRLMDSGPKEDGTDRLLYVFTSDIMRDTAFGSLHYQSATKPLIIISQDLTLPLEANRQPGLNGERGGLDIGILPIYKELAERIYHFFSRASGFVIMGADYAVQPMKKEIRRLLSEFGIPFGKHSIAEADKFTFNIPQEVSKTNNQLEM